MIKYLITYQLIYKKMVDKYSYVWAERFFNDFCFSEELPCFSTIIDKLMKKHNCEESKLVIMNLIPLKPEPNDLEVKNVIKIGQN